jgi:hypothetical protein
MDQCAGLTPAAGALSTVGGSELKDFTHVAKECRLHPTSGACALRKFFGA